MLIDHVGLYGFPEADWLRAVGRCSAPIWLFLAGYGARLPISWPLCLSAIAVAALNYVWLDSLLSFSMLVGIIISRLLLLQWGGWILRNPLTFVAGCFLLLPLEYLWDYGSFALLFLAIGYCHYHGLPKLIRSVMLMITASAYMVWQALIFQFNTVDCVIMVAFCLPIFWVMSRFDAASITIDVNTYTRRLMRWLSRQSLTVYVAHLAILIPLKALYWL